MFEFLFPNTGLATVRKQDNFFQGAQNLVGDNVTRRFRGGRIQM